MIFDDIPVKALGGIIFQFVFVDAGHQVAPARRPMALRRLVQEGLYFCLEGGLIVFAEIISGEIIADFGANGGIPGEKLERFFEREFRLAGFPEREKRQRLLEGDVAPE